jgi:hypothetical protein
MITTVAVALALSGTTPSQNPASQLVTKMLAYYANAQTMTGTIMLTVSDGAGQAQVSTDLAYERASKLYIKQAKGGSSPRVWYVSSDGKNFSYEAPGNLPGSNQRLIEPVTQRTDDYETDANGNFVLDAKKRPKPKMLTYDIGRIYSVAAPNIGDRSVPLDIAIGRHEDLQHDVLTWMTVQSGGKVTVDGVEANSVIGKWRPYGEASNDANNAPGQYELDITDDGKLVRYIILQYIRDPRNGNTVNLTETWKVNLVPGGKPDAALFKLIQ